MASYNKKLAQKNEELITVVIDKFLSAIQNIMVEVISISEKLMVEHPELIEADEIKCKDREKLELQNFINVNGRNPDEDEVLTLYKLRFKDAFEQLKKGHRMSHSLRNGGYDWPEFFEIEEDEPEDETMARQAFADETRTKYRNIGMTDFIKHSYPYWDNILEKDINFLINHFSSLLPNSEISDKLSILFGDNGEKMYISEEKLTLIWRLIHLCIKMSIKYIKHTGRTGFTNTTLFTKKETTTTFDVEKLIETWKVKL